MDNEEKVRAKFVRSICSPIIVLLLSILYRFVAYSESRAGNPMFGAEDMGCFITLLIGDGETH